MNAAAVDDADEQSAAVRRPRRRHHQPQQRKRKLTIRVSPAEEAEIKHAARERVQTAARFLATSALNAARGLSVDHDPDDVADRVLDELAASRAHLARVGNNLNQVAFALNAGGQPRPGELEAVLGALRTAIKGIDERAQQMVERRR
ncbi:hypothetical protein ACFVH7_12200 [Kitasatospora indigofera]|uniref:plasmid mobilization protein n=1 Tax=Kitasatospora indigofera TaxID=67307 RepID=UPI003628EFFE